MELSEKIQKLRKERGLTQEQFAEQMFVSRTAVSKWETGRGVPSVESLQMIAKFFGITLDELLGAEEVASIAGKENKENIRRFAARIDGIFNVAAVAGVLLPLYKIEKDEVFYSVPLYQFDGWLAVLYWFFPVVMAMCGVLWFLMCKDEWRRLGKCIRVVALVMNVCAVFLFVLSGQPYPAVMFFVLLLMKGSVTLTQCR